MKRRMLLLIPLLHLIALYVAPPSALAGVWRPEVRLTQIAGESWGPRLAAFGGVVHVVWFENLSPSPDYEIFYSRSLDNGTTWSAPQNISNNSGRDDIFPYVAADAFGVYVVWSSNFSNGDLFFKRSTNDGSTWGSEQQLTNAAGYSRSSDILADRQGVLHIVWYDDRVGYSNIYHRQSCDHGATWTAEKWVTQFDGVVDNEQPRIAQSDDNTLYLLFRSSRDGMPQGGWPPYGRYLARGQNTGCPGGTAWLYPAQLVSGGLPNEHANNYNGTLVAGKSGRVHLAYWDEEAGNNVIYRRGVPAGAGWGPPIDLSGFSLTHPQAEAFTMGTPGLAEDSAGAVHAVFSEQSAIKDTFISVGRLFYGSSSNGGTTWNATVQLGTSNVTASPQTVVHNGRLHVVWIDFRDNNFGSEIYYRYQDLSLPTLVDHYYNSILRRPPDPGGKAFWESEVARVTSLGMDLKEAYRVMAGQFFNSAEYLSFNRTNTDFVTDLYNTFFQRSPDAGGLSFWVGQLNAGLPRDIVMFWFLFSTEFETFMTGLYGNTSVRAEVDAVVDFYRGFLNRLADNTGFTHWLNQFRTAQCQGTAAVVAQVESISKQFAESPEYLNRARTNAQYVADLYYAFLRRGADSSGFNFWLDQLNSGARTRDQLRRDFIQSAEFQGRVNAIINEGCLQ